MIPTRLNAHTYDCVRTRIAFQNETNTSRPAPSRRSSLDRRDHVARRRRPRATHAERRARRALDPDARLRLEVRSRRSPWTPPFAPIISPERFRSSASRQRHRAFNVPPDVEHARRLSAFSGRSRPRTPASSRGVRWPVEIPRTHRRVASRSARFPRVRARAPSARSETRRLRFIRSASEKAPLRKKARISRRVDAPAHDDALSLPHTRDFFNNQKPKKPAPRWWAAWRAIPRTRRARTTSPAATSCPRRFAKSGRRAFCAATTRTSRAWRFRAPAVSWPRASAA